MERSNLFVYCKDTCDPLEYDADACDWPQLTNHCRVIQWSERPEPPEL